MYGFFFSERPLLIYGTKFDVRQYFLAVNHSTSVQIWMYKVCYLRFSSQSFDLTNFNASVHLTNHCVQKHFKIDAKRSCKLPACNMWNLEQFQDYLKSINKSKVWADSIYPSMKKNFCASVIASTNDCDLEQNCFQLYGCDFMILDNFETVLLEINSSPDLSPSTPITKQICADVMEDTVKGIKIY